MTDARPYGEQELSAGALCYNLLLTANASGWAGCWLSEWIAFDKDIALAMGLADHERIRRDHVSWHHRYGSA